MPLIKRGKLTAVRYDFNVHEKEISISFAVDKTTLNFYSSKFTFFSMKCKF